MVLRGLSGLLRELPSEVVTLPRFAGRLGVQTEDPLVEFTAMFLPGVILVAQFGIAIHAPNDRLEVGELTVLARLAETDDSKITVEQGTEKSPKLVEIDNPMPAWKRAGFKDTSELVALADVKPELIEKA